jgi:hypothetical protein
MDCNFGIKVSLFLDGELSAEGSEQVRKHLEICAECRQSEQYFLFFREQIKESVENKDFALPEFLSAKPTPFWKKAIPIPAPVFIVLLLTLIGFGIWFLLPKPSQNSRIAKDKTTQTQPDDASLARFDKGGRAEIYVVRQEQK